MISFIKLDQAVTAGQREWEENFNFWKAVKE
jgi:hypothetical protein